MTAFATAVIRDYPRLTRGEGNPPEMQEPGLDIEQARDPVYVSIVRVPNTIIVQLLKLAQPRPTPTERRLAYYYTIFLADKLIFLFL